MAETIASGIKESNSDITVKLYNSARSDTNDIITEIFKSKAILMGSPTVNRVVLHSMAGILGVIRGLGFKKKKAAAFGTYGWSGESVKLITEELERAGFEIMDEGIRVMWNPGPDDKKACVEFGRKIGDILKD